MVVAEALDQAPSNSIRNFFFFLIANNSVSDQRDSTFLFLLCVWKYLFSLLLVEEISALSCVYKKHWFGSLSAHFRIGIVDVVSS